MCQDKLYIIHQNSVIKTCFCKLSNLQLVVNETSLDIENQNELKKAYEWHQDARRKACYLSSICLFLTIIVIIGIWI
jgi:hypothetical protein